jgi:glycosyltransferase involved in cell wall biosynthesis
MPEVLQLINSFHQGGTERQAVQLARLLKEGGRYRPRLACLDGGGTLRAEAERLGLGEMPEFPLNSFYDRNAARQLRRLAGYMREHEFAVVHAHDFYTNVLGMAAAALARVPARIASRRDILGFRTPAQSFVERGAFRLAHRVLVNAGAVRDFLVGAGVPAGKVVVLYNGLDTHRVEQPEGFERSRSLEAFGLPPGRRFVTIVANVQHEIKDHPTFLRAARAVRDAVPEAAFVIAGEGRLMESLRAYAGELGLGGDVFFTGRCERVAELLAVSDVCVLSSKAEGFSNSILEYMAAARPVVVTEVGGAREAVLEGETGFLVPPGDAGRMAERITLLLREPERARAMGERGRSVVREKFSCEAQRAGVEALYDQLLSRAAPGAARARSSRVEREGA